jgi:hypothetical protein
MPLQIQAMSLTHCPICKEPWLGHVELKHCMKTEITKIKLKLKDREIELTAQEARDVQKELNKLFEMEKTELQKLQEEWAKLKPQKEYVPYPVYPAPIIIERNTPYWPRPWEISFGGTTGGITDSNSGTLCMAVGQVA